MKYSFFNILFLLLPILATAQQKAGLNIWPVKHASFALTFDGKTIYVDPADETSLYLYKQLPAPDMILITDIHGDHLDLKMIKALNTKNAIIIAPQAVADKLPAELKEKLVILNNGDKTDQLGTTITAMPMYNLPEEPGSRHTKGRGNGYLLNINGKNIYISGDTEDIPEMRALKNIDIAFVCMNLPYTMDIHQAADAVLEFKPGIVFPYHYRGQDVKAFKKLVTDKNKRIEVRLREWYPK